MLRALALALVATVALPAASAGSLWDPEESPCDGQALAPGIEDQNQARFAEFACAYGPYVTDPFCATAAGMLDGLYIFLAVLAPGSTAPEAC